MTENAVHDYEWEPDVLRIIELIEGGQSERAACREVGMDRMTFRSRALKIGGAIHYARATAALAGNQVERLESAIEEMRNGQLDPKAARVEIDARKWIASKLLPKQWGDKQAVELTGANGGPIKTESKVSLDGLTDAQKAALASVAVEGE